MAVIVPSVVDPSRIVTVLLASAVPAIVGLVLLVDADFVVITGAVGAVVSTVSVMADDDADTLPAASLALTVIVWADWLNVPDGA